MAVEKHKLEIPARGSRGRRVTGIFFKLFRPFASGQISRYRKNATAEPPRMGRLPLVLLTTLGAKSGRERTSVVGGLAEDNGSWLIVAAKGGSPTHPAWFINLCKNPDDVWLEVGNRTFQARPRLLKGDEQKAAYAKVVAVSPQYANYRCVTDREIPVIRLTPIEP